MKKFLVRMLLLVLAVGLATGAINALYIHNDVNAGTMGSWKNDDAYIGEVPTGIQVCNFGSSHAYYGFNYEAFDENLVCFNFALPSQSLSYDARILRNYADRLAPGATVLIAVSYNSFFGGKETDSADFYAKNKRYYHFLSPENIKEYDADTAFFVKYLPSLTVNSVKLANTLLGRHLVPVFWQGTTSAEAAAKHAQKRYMDHIAANVGPKGERIVNREEIQAVTDMILLCREYGARPVLVTMPYLVEYPAAVREHDAAFFDDFEEIMEEIIRETGVTWLDHQDDTRFSNRYDWFFNSDHLNREGAAVFTAIVLLDAELDQKTETA